MGKYSGTDDFRGETDADLVMEHAYKVGRLLGWYYGQRTPDERCGMVIEKDTKRSSYMFEYSPVAGLTASGADVYLLHVTATPSVSYAVRTEGSNCGIMISASHNPFYDNGIKVINGRGERLEESVILKVEKYLDGEIGEIPLAKREHIGRTAGFTTSRNRCIGYLIPIATRSFKNIEVALDCSNGSASTITKNVFDALGTETHVVNNEPNGLNINTDCGSIHIEHLQKFVTDEKYDTGFAYDDDADRYITVDKSGRVVDRDSIMYICGKYMEEQGNLFNGTVVTTIMSNFGLYKAFDQEGTTYMKTAVGGKYVYENMAATGHCLDRERFDYIIFSKHATTGNGILTSLKVVEVVLGKKQPLDRLASEVGIYPQVLKNVRVKDKKAAQGDEIVQAEVARVIRSLGSDGRILLHQSGTEPVVRVVAKAPDIQTCEAYVDQVVQVMKDRGHCIQGCMQGAMSGSLKMEGVVLEYILWNRGVKAIAIGNNQPTTPYYQLL